MTRLEKATHITLITLAIVALSSIVTQRFGLRVPGASARTGQITPLQHIGSKISAKVGHWERANTNVVLALRSDCPYCKSSMPLYREIADIAKRPGSGVASHVVTQEEPRLLKDLLASEGIAVNSVVRVSMDELGIVGTPTVLVANSAGKVLDEWVGKLSAAREQSLIASLETHR